MTTKQTNMSNKLQELTDRLYSEGLSKGKEQGEVLVSQARSEAEQILAQAKAQAEQIIQQAEKQASDLKSKAQSDVRMASEKSIQATKKEIESLMTSSICAPAVKEALSDKDFFKQVILEIARRFDATQSADLSLVLPQSMQTELEDWAQKELSKALSKGVSVSFSKKIGSGLNIGPKDGSWFISFSGSSFEELISGYLSPVTRKLLFG